MPAFVSPQMLSPTLIGRAMSGASDIAAASPAAYPTYALTTRFKVSLPGSPGIGDLGGWASCKGLKIDFKFRQINRGGDYTSSVVLPERLEYDKIVLERAVEKSSTEKVKKWLQTVTETWLVPTGKRPDGCTVQITLLDPTNAAPELAHWVLKDVYPVSWSGPSMSASGSDTVALETLVLQHGGFEWDK